MTQPCSRFLAVQEAILAEIERPDFDAALPPLSDDSWLRILAISQLQYEENERLEFVGDAVMYATIGRQLYSEIPTGTPGLYTTLRSALHSNLTFSRLAEKLDILAVSNKVLKALTAKTFGEGALAASKSRKEVKATADLFETIIGTYFNDAGFEALFEWSAGLYKQLIAAGNEAYSTHLPSAQAQGKPPVPKVKKTNKRKRPSVVRKLAAKIKNQPKTSTRRVVATPQKQRPAKVAVRVVSSSSKNTARVISSVPTSSARAAPSGAGPSKHPVFIDLTAAEDSDMELQSDIGDEPPQSSSVSATVRSLSKLKQAVTTPPTQIEDHCDAQIVETMLLGGNT